MLDYLSDLIYRTAYTEVFGYERSPYHELDKKLYEIEDKYFKNIPTDVEKLPRILNLRLRDRVINEFKMQIEFYLGQSFATHLQNKIRQNIQASCPDAEPYSITNSCNEAKKVFLITVNERYTFEPTEEQKYSYQQGKNYSKISEAQLLQKYENAKQRTIAERLSRVNKTDVLAFYHALISKTFWDCQQLIMDRMIVLADSIFFIN